MFDFLDATYICLLAGPIIAGIVSVFKRWTLVARHPKWFALAFSLIIPFVQALTLYELDWAMLAECLLVPFAGAVATYEVAKSATEGDIV